MHGKWASDIVLVYEAASIFDSNSKYLTQFSTDTSFLALNVLTNIDEYPNGTVFGYGCQISASPQNQVQPAPTSGPTPISGSDKITVVSTKAYFDFGSNDSSLPHFLLN